MRINITEEELIVQGLFQNKIGVVLEKIKKTSKKTPDFWIQKDGERIAVCEIKTLTDPEHQYTDISANDRSWNSARRERSLSERMRTGHVIASQQLQGYVLPRILLYLNYDMADHLDLDQLLNSVPAEERLDAYILFTMDFGHKRKLNGIYYVACSENGINIGQVLKIKEIKEN